MTATRGKLLPSLESKLAFLFESFFRFSLSLPSTVDGFYPTWDHSDYGISLCFWTLWAHYEAQACGHHRLKKDKSRV